MPKTQSQVERDCNSLVKLILSEMEELAGLPPAQAADPYSFDDRRRVVVRKIWQLYKDAVTCTRGE